MGISTRIIRSMNANSAAKLVVVAMVSIACVSVAQGVDIETVTVGNLGKAGKISRKSVPDGYSPATNPHISSVFVSLYIT